MLLIHAIYSCIGSKQVALFMKLLWPLYDKRCDVLILTKIIDVQKCYVKCKCLCSGSISSTFSFWEKLSL